MTNDEVNSQNKPSGHGKLIVVEGVDGTGKTTQIGRIVDWLGDRLNPNGDPDGGIVSVRDPGGTELGDRLRGILLDGDLSMHRRTEALMFMASRSELVARIIAPTLRRGGVVVSDRYLLSTVVYQSVGVEQFDAGASPDGDGPIETVSTDDLWRFGRFAAGGIDPDLTLFLDAPVEVTLARVGEQTDRMESRGPAYYRSVRQSYLEQLDRTGGPVATIDASVDIDGVWLQIRSVLETAFAD